jgi:hypothetical protein
LASSAKRQKASLAVVVFRPSAYSPKGYFPEHLLSHHKSLARVNPRVVDTVWFGLDPASHMRSSMGLAAIAIREGVVTVLGTASVKAGPANLEDCCKAVVAFVAAVVRHRETDAARVIPVIECNASEITARQYLDAIVAEFGQKVSVPFEKTTFKTCVTDGIGVYTTKGNKQAAVLGLRRNLIDGTLRIWEKVQTTDSSAYNPTHIPVSVEDALETLYEQLAAVKDNEDGTISGQPVPSSSRVPPSPSALPSSSRVPRSASTPFGVGFLRHRPHLEFPARPPSPSVPPPPSAPPSSSRVPRSASTPLVPAIPALVLVLSSPLGKGDGGDDDAAQALLMARHWAGAVMDAKPDQFGPRADRGGRRLL